MSWNKCLYQYHKQRGGSYLGGREDDGLLALSWKDRLLVVDISMAGGGRYGPYPHVRVRVPVTLGKPYELTIGPEKALSSGVNTLLKVVPGLPDNAILPKDFGFPEVTKKRLIRTENVPFTKLVLGSLEFRNALLACPRDRVEVRPGPGEEGLHLITVTTAAALEQSDWYTGYNGDYMGIYGTEEEKLQLSRQVEEEFFPRMDRFLELARAACGAVTQWPI